LLNALVNRTLPVTTALMLNAFEEAAQLLWDATLRIDAACAPAEVSYALLLNALILNAPPRRQALGAKLAEGAAR
jgi:hypothetical protein